MSESGLFSAREFRARAINQMGGPVEDAWRDHGDHLLNPQSIREIEGIRLKDAAVLIGIVDDGDGEDAKVILTQRTSTLRKHSGQIAFPGGGIDEEDATPEVAALREAEEEVGLHPSFVETVGRLPLYLSGTGFRIQPVLAVVQRGFTITPNPDEVDEVFEVPLSFLMNPHNHRRDSRMWQGKVRHFYTMPYHDYYIWGITAGILRTLYERLYA
ncbi:CoA pyrophosphatase [Agrobacterium sp. ES01]|uniref:CoA pyrophosphatase n=1 Tax=Agrobacterium sp. ES01 TaxID=3420714 RepID=UPI003D0B8843